MHCARCGSAGGLKLRGEEFYCRDVGLCNINVMFELRRQVTRVLVKPRPRSRLDRVIERLLR